MSKPQSIKIDPWVGFPKQPYSIIDDDFCHEKPYVEKFSVKNDKATVNFKGTITKKSGNWNVADETKIWFDILEGRSLYAKIKSSDYLKAHYDHGIIENNGKKWNLYATMNFNRALKNWVLKAGVANISNNCHSDNRLKVTLDDDRQFHWYHRTVINKDKYRFGLLTVFDLGKKVLEKNNLLLAYTHNSQHSVYLRAESDGYRKKNPTLEDPSSIFENVIVDYVNNIDSKSKAALEASYNLRLKKLSSVQAVYQRKEDKNTYKIGVNDKLDVKGFVKRPVYKFQNMATLTTGVGVTGVLKKEPAFKTGFQLDVNL